MIEALQKLLGKDNVLTEDFEKIMFGADWSPRTKDQIHLPDVVVNPSSVSNVVGIVEIARENDTPVVCGGGLTGMGGGSIPLFGGIFIDTRSMNRVVEFDHSNQTIRVQAGMTMKEINDVLEPHGLWIPNLPESQWSCTIGSEIACDNDSTFGMKYGKILNSLLSVQIVDGNGEVLELGHRKAHFTSSGYKLKDLIVGSEGTLGVITEATLKCQPIPPNRRVEMVLLPSLKEGIKFVNECCKQGIFLEATHINCKRRLDFYTHAYRKKYGKKPEIPDWAGCVVAISISGYENLVNIQFGVVGNIIEDMGGAYVKETEIVDGWWKSKYTLDFEPFSQKWPDSQRVKKFGANDPAIPMGNLQPFYNEFIKLTEKYGLEVLGMNAYLEQPNSIGLSLSCAIFVDYRNGDEIERYRLWNLEMCKMAIRYEGSMSSYISDTYFKVPMMTIEHGHSYDYMKKIKHIFDPKNIMNPGKKFMFDNGDD